MHWLQAAKVPGQVAVLLPRCPRPRPRQPAEEGGAAVLGQPGAPAEPAPLQPAEAGRCQGWSGRAVTLPKFFISHLRIYKDTMLMLNRCLNTVNGLQRSESKGSFQNELINQPLVMIFYMRCLVCMPFSISRSPVDSSMVRVRGARCRMRRPRAGGWWGSAPGSPTTRCAASCPAPSARWVQYSTVHYSTVQ